jgi:hypothetical protein
MADRHISMRGEVVDFNRLRMANAEKPALGNASMNARGDLIGHGGVIIKTQEQIDAEHEALIAAQRENSRPVDIKDMAAVAAAAGKMPPPKQVNPDDADFDPETPPQANRQRRKMIESD